MIKLLLLITVAFCASQSWAAPANQGETLVFGLPLGGKLDEPIPQCKKTKEPPYTVSALCQRDKEWRGKDGSRSIGVQIPDDALPAWAGLGYADLSISPSGLLTKIELSGSFTDADDMRRSISLRFGPPTHDFSSYKSPAAWVWVHADIVITTYGTARGCCNAVFEMRSEYESRIQRVEEERRRRPATP